MWLLSPKKKQPRGSSLGSYNGCFGGGRTTQAPPALIERRQEREEGRVPSNCLFLVDVVAVPAVVAVAVAVAVAVGGVVVVVVVGFVSNNFMGNFSKLYSPYPRNF